MLKGQKVKCLASSGYSFCPCDGVIVEVSNNFSKVNTGCSTWNFKNKDLELVEPTPTPLTNTIITDIKDEEQHKRVQEKLFWMGCKWIGENDNTFYSPDKDDIKQIVLDDKGRIWVDCTIPGGGNHITANDFLQEVDEIQPFHFDRPLPEKPITVNKDYLNNVDFGFKLPEPEIKIVRGRTKAEQHMADIIQYYKTPEVKGSNNKPMNNIVSFFNDLTVSAEDKELRKAGLKDDNLNWTRDAQEIVRNLESKELGYKNYAELSDRTLCEGLSPLEYNTLFTKFYAKLLDTAKKFNRKDEKKAK